MANRAYFDEKLISSILLAVLILVLTFYVLKIVFYFIPAICMALFLMYLSEPLYTWLEKHIKNKSVPITISLLFFIALFFIFFIYFVAILSDETAQLLSNPAVGSILKEKFSIESFPFIEDSFLETINSLSPEKMDTLLVNLSTMPSYRTQTVYFLNFFYSIILKVGYILLQFFMAFLIAFYMVKDREAIERQLLCFIPKKHHTFIKRVIHEIDISLNALFMSIFLTATISGVTSYIIYAYFNIPYAGLLSILTAMISVLPIVGAWLVYLPLTALVFLLFGAKLALVFLILNIILVSSLPDFITKPLIVVKDKKMNLMLVIIGFLGGMATFGPLGFLIGPIIILVLMSILYVLVS